jgi:hypothetical protein
MTERDGGRLSPPDERDSVDNPALPCERFIVVATAQLQGGAAIMTGGCTVSSGSRANRWRAEAEVMVVG